MLMVQVIVQVFNALKPQTMVRFRSLLFLVTRGAGESAHRLDSRVLVEVIEEDFGFFMVPERAYTTFLWV